MQRVYNKQIMRGVNLTCVKAEKFKTGCLSMTLITQLDKKTAAMNAMLPSVLRRGTARLPDMESIAAELDDMYGVRIEPALRKKGELQCIGFYADFPDDAFLPDGRNILEKTADLMGEMLLQPATSGGRLKAEYVDSERENLISDIKAEINDKRTYASMRLTEMMFKGERYGISRLGSLHDAEKITVHSLTRHYRELISSSIIQVFYCGAAEPEYVEQVIRGALATLPRVETYNMPTTELLTEEWTEPVKYLTEKMDVTQGKLVMGYRLGEAMRRPNHAALMVFNAVFGGAVTSKLFMNVRERLSLCYYASSGVDRLKGIMRVSSGIEFSKYNEALSEIERQLESVKNGEILPIEMEGAKKAVITAIYSALDEPGGLESLYLDESILGLSGDPSDLVPMVSEVTMEQVAKIADCAKLDSVYFLTGEDDNA